MKNRIKPLLFALVLAAVMMVFSGVCLAYSFSADVVTKADNEVMTGKMYMSNNKMRMDSADMISITRMDKKVIWIVMKQEKMYLEQAMRPDTFVPGAETAPTAKVEKVFIANEAVDGKPTKKYKVTVTDAKSSESYYEWLSDEFLIPLRIAGIDGKWSHEYRNVKVGEPPASLFEVPAGYQKMSF